MGRIIRIDPGQLEWGRALGVENRLRQANAAFRLFHALHRPFERPFHRGFDTVEEFHAWEKEQADSR